jgi:amino acid transporter
MKGKSDQIFSQRSDLLVDWNNISPMRHNSFRPGRGGEAIWSQATFRVMLVRLQLVVDRRMTPTERANEHLKLVANWLNTVATAIIAAGTFVPAAQFIFGVLPADTNPIAVYGMGLICIGSGVLIHLAGHQFLESLK